MNILKQDQYDRKIREIEIRAKNIKRRERREKLWGRGVKAKEKEIGTVDELLVKNQNFSKMIQRKKKQKNRGKRRKIKQTSIKQFPSTTKIQKINYVSSKKRIPSQSLVEIDFTITQKLKLIKNDECKSILSLFYSQSKELLKEMKDRMSNSQEIIKSYMEKLEKVIKGDKSHKYMEIESNEETGFIGRTVLREQKIKYRKLWCINSMEKRYGIIGLFKEIVLENDQIILGKFNQNLAINDKLTEEGKNNYLFFNF